MSLFDSLVQIASLSSTNEYGEHTFGATEQYSARVSFKQAKVMAEGEELVAQGFVVISGIINVTTADQLTLPDSSQPQILAVQNAIGGDLSHTKILFG